MASRKRQRPRRPARRATLWLYGRHAVSAALANPRRPAHRLLYSGDVPPEIPPERAGLTAQSCTPRDLEDLLPGAVHQGWALETEPLEETAIEDVLAACPERARIVVLDQVSDPRNVGAILRSAAAYRARAVIMQDRHAPPEGGALAKSASGALETVPLVRVINLARALDQLAEAGFWRYGLDAGAAQSVAEIDFAARSALVLGAEGAGLRRLTAERCDQMMHLAMNGEMESLNVAVAASIALFASRT